MDTSFAPEEANQLNVRAEQYRELLNKIKEKKALWRATSRLQVFEIIKGVVNYTSLGGLYANNRDTNKVILEFQKDLSDYSAIYNGVETRLTKFGGQLVFKQLSNGLISIDILYPTIEHIHQTQVRKQLELIEPNNITRETVVGHVLKFFDEMLIWELKGFENF